MTWIRLTSKEKVCHKKMNIQSLSTHPMQKSVLVSFLVHKTFLEPHSKTTFQHSAKQLKNSLGLKHFKKVTGGEKKGKRKTAPYSSYGQSQVCGSPDPILNLKRCYLAYAHFKAEIFTVASTVLQHVLARLPSKVFFTFKKGCT